MLESTRIDVYARRSASRCARESWNKPGRNSRSPDFVLELSPKLWFRSFVTFRDSSLGYLLQTSSSKTIYRWIKAIAVSDSIHVFFHYDRGYSVARATTLRYADRSISVHAYGDRRFSRSTRIYVTPFSS